MRSLHNEEPDDAQCRMQTVNQELTGVLFRVLTFAICITVASEAFATAVWVAEFSTTVIGANIVVHRPWSRSNPR